MTMHQFLVEVGQASSSNLELGFEDDICDSPFSPLPATFCDPPDCKPSSPNNSSQGIPNAIFRKI
jgi:hypothetical protein